MKDGCHWVRPSPNPPAQPSPAHPSLARKAVSSSRARTAQVSLSAIVHRLDEWASIYGLYGLYGLHGLYGLWATMMHPISRYHFCTIKYYGDMFHSWGENAMAHGHHGRTWGRRHRAVSAPFQEAHPLRMGSSPVRNLW